MTPDEWVRSPDGQTVVEAMARADYETWFAPVRIPWERQAEEMRAKHHASAEAVLLAALRVRRMTPCPDCDGKGEVCLGSWRNCDRCDSRGVVPGVPLLVDALMEQDGVGVMQLLSPPVPRGHAAARGPSRIEYPLYRVRVPAAQPEEPR